MLDPTLQEKLQTVVERHAELAALLASAEIINDRDQYQKLTKEYAQLDPLVICMNQLRACQDAIATAKQLSADPDPEMRALADAELKTAATEQVDLEQKITVLLLPTDPNDQCNIFLEIRAGAGGDEAAIFAGDLFRMYARYAERRRWQVEVVSENSGEHGGYKEIIARVSGQGVYSELKFESGAHRVQRVPATEAQGRIHTSTCTVAILAEIDEIDRIEINPADLRIDTYRASGAGGQHVNKTDSAIRITHLPSGLVIECQDERSQHKNRARAMSLLQSKLLAREQESRQKEQAETRRNLVGTGDRSERIRTYNFPQGRLTDHRINLTLYKLEDIINGDIDQVIQPLQQAHQADLLAELAASH